MNPLTGTVSSFYPVRVGETGRSVVCPACRASLKIEAGVPRVRCPKCDITFPARAAKAPNVPWRAGLISAAVTFALIGGCAALINSGREGRDDVGGGDVTLAPGVTLSPDEVAEAEFSALLVRQGVQFRPSDRDELILRGRTVCVFLSQPDTTMAMAVAQLSDAYGYSRADARAIERAAVNALCDDRASR